MRRIIVVWGFCLLGTVSIAQSSKKLTKEDSAPLTTEQRLVHETDRKSKHGKKDVSLKKKIKISKKVDRQSRRIRKPKTPPTTNKRNKR